MSSNERSFSERALLGVADLTGADLREAQFGYADMERSVLAEADLSEAVMEYAVLSNANLCKARLVNSALNGADLSGASLAAANLTKAGLTEADLREANLYRADLQWASLEGADFRYAVFDSTKLVALGRLARSAQPRGGRTQRPVMPRPITLQRSSTRFLASSSKGAATRDKRSRRCAPCTDRESGFTRYSCRGPVPTPSSPSAWSLTSGPRTSPAGTIPKT